MPYVAYNPESDDIHFADQASAESDYVCIDCPEAVEYVRSHLRNSDSGDPTRVTAHFRYSNCTHGTVDEVSDGSGGGGGGGGAGETQLHKRRKRAALHEALQRFPAADYDTEYTVGSKRADALLEFEDPHEEYGKGLVIEYQHKNEGKDIEETQEHFARHHYTTVWLWEDQFTFSSSIPDIDLFGGEVYTPWPDAVPEQSQWRGEGLHHEKRRKWRQAYAAGLTKTVVEADILKHWVLDTTAEYWEKKHWEDRFRDYIIYPYKRDVYAVRQSLSTDEESLIKLPNEYYENREKRHWRETDWQDRFRGNNDPVKRARFEWQVEEGIWDPDTNVPATYHLAPWLTDAGNILRVRFNTDRHGVEKSLEELRYWLGSFESDGEADRAFEPGEEVYNRVLDGYVVTMEDPSETHPFDFEALGEWKAMFAIVPDQVERTYRKRAETDGQNRASNRPNKDTDDLERPYGPFDDVQCHVCGNYNYAKNEPESCQCCGNQYDWEWNVRTGRVSPESVPEHVTP